MSTSRSPDPPFRRICHRLGADIVYTEFISSEGLIRDAHAYLETGVIPEPPSIDERVEVALEHLRNNLDYKGEKYGILELRKFWGGYLKGLPLASHVRRDLVVAPDYETIEERLERFKEEVVEHDREQEERRLAFIQ